MRKLVVALLLLVACAHAPRPTPAVDAAAERRRLLELPPAILHKEARELMARGDWEAARVRLELYLAKAPDSAAAHFDAGQSFAQYLRSRRLERCRAELVHQLYAHLSITEICFRWGFNDSSHFSHAFREQYGMSPRDYRKAMRARQEPEPLGPPGEALSR